MVRILNKYNHELSKLERSSLMLTKWVGTPVSVFVHSIFFAGVFLLRYLGVATDEILLILTTVVSLEAIYLSIFIQMSVNRATESLEDVEEDLEDMQEESTDELETRKILLHMGQQVRLIQQDLGYFRKKGLLKVTSSDIHQQVRH